MRNPYICGKNRINLPESGCSECEGLEYRIHELEVFKQNIEDNGYNALTNKPTINGVTVEGNKTSENYLITPISDYDIETLTPFDCYEPPCADSRVCYGEVCCAKVACSNNNA